MEAQAYQVQRFCGPENISWYYEIWSCTEFKTREQQAGHNEHRLEPEGKTINQNVKPEALPYLPPSNSRLDRSDKISLQSSVSLTNVSQGKDMCSVPFADIGRPWAADASHGQHM